MNEEMIKVLKYLRLSATLAHWDDYVAKAKRREYSPVRLLEHVLKEEYQHKRENARALRVRKACIPEILAIETFPFDRQPALNRNKVMSLYDGFDYMTKNRNIIWVGPTGVGKSGLATGFLLHALNRGHTGRYILFQDLVSALHNSSADHSEEKLLKKFARYDCLLIDELGYIEIEPTHVGLFFTLLQKRHHRKPTLITSNLGFSEWNTFLKNAHLTAALIDRLTENGYVVNMRKCVSLRPKLSEPV